MSFTPLSTASCASRRQGKRRKIRRRVCLKGETIVDVYLPHRITERSILSSIHLSATSSKCKCLRNTEWSALYLLLAFRNRIATFSPLATRQNTPTTPPREPEKRQRKRVLRRLNFTPTFIPLPDTSEAITQSA